MILAYILWRYIQINFFICPLLLKIFLYVTLENVDDKIGKLCDICFACKGFMVLVKGKEFASQKTFDRGKSKVVFSVCSIKKKKKTVTEKVLHLYTELRSLLTP